MKKIVKATRLDAVHQEHDIEEKETVTLWPTTAIGFGIMLVDDSERVVTGNHECTMPVPRPPVYPEGRPP